MSEELMWNGCVCISIYFGRNLYVCRSKERDSEEGVEIEHLQEELYEVCPKSNASCFVMLAHDIRSGGGGGMVVEIEPSHHYSLTCCCHVTGSRGAV